MFKTESRKGFAVALASVLAFTGLVTTAAPATAAPAVTGLNLEVASDGSTGSVAVLANSAVTLKAFTYGTAAPIGDLKYKITSPGGVTVSYTISATATPNLAGTFATALSTSETADVVADGGSGVRYLTIRLHDGNNTTSAVAVNVEGFISAAGSNDPANTPAGEKKSVAVSFVKLADVTFAAKLDAFKVADESLTGLVTVTGVNQSALQFNSGRGVGFVVTQGSTTSSTVSATYDADEDAFVASVGTSSAEVATLPFSTSSVVSADSFKIQATFDDGVVDAVRGTAVTFETSKVILTRIQGASSSATATNTANGSGRAVSVNPATSSVAVYAFALTNSTAVKGVTLNFKISENAANSLDAAAVITVDGKTLKNSNAGTVQSITVPAVTDADGKAQVIVTFTGQKKDNAFKVEVLTDQNVNAAAATVYTFVEPAAASAAWLDEVDVDGTIAPQLIVAKNTNFSLNFAALDTYKALLTGAGHTVQVSYSTTVAVQGTVTDGKATVTYPGFAADGAYDLGVTVLKNGAAVTATTLISVKVGTAGTPASLTIVDNGFGTSAAGISLSTEDFKAVDTRLGATAPKSNNGKVIEGVVKDANGNVVAGTSVTIAGTDLQFNVANTLYVADKVTVLTDANGAYKVTVYSNKTGKKTATVTAGAASKTQDIYYAAAAYSAGATLTVTTTATGDVAAPGTTVRATVKLVDKYGNPVKVTNETGTASFAVKVTGPGFIGTIPTATDASGEAAVSVLLGSSDTGSLVFTASYDGDDTGTTLAALTPVTKTVTVQAPDAPAVDVVVGSFNGRWAVRVENAKGSAVSVKVGGKWYKATATSDKFVFSRKSKVGANVLVKVWVAGDLQNEQTITVK
jgi:hypothetical protein